MASISESSQEAFEVAEGEGVEVPSTLEDSGEDKSANRESQVNMTVR